MESFIHSILNGLGALLVLNFAVRALIFVYSHLLKSVNLSKYKRRQCTEEGNADTWAIVTGASDGIGKEFAIQLAREGFNVVIIARTRSKLEEVAKECDKACWFGSGHYVRYRKVETLIYPMDFSQCSVSDYQEKLKDTLVKKGIYDKVRILINNVGITYDAFMAEFGSEGDGSIDSRLLKVNCEPQIQMTNLVLPVMKRHNCGGILNMSSICCLAGAPLIVTSASTKAFNRTFSIALSNELAMAGRKYCNIDVLAVTPSWVATDTTALPESTFDVVSTSSFVWRALAQLDIARSVLGGPETGGHFNHSLLTSATTRLPDWLKTMITISSVKQALIDYKATLQTKKRNAENKSK